MQIRKYLIFIMVFILIFISIGQNISGNDNKYIDKRDLWVSDNQNFLLNDVPDEKWNTTFGGIDYDDGYSVIQTKDGGYVIAGFSFSFGAGNWDVWLIKTNSYGIEEWNHTYGGVSYDRGYSVQQTSDNGFVITGCTHSFGAGNWDVWLIKTDSYGIEEWNHTYGGGSEDWGYQVQQTSDNGYIITGYTDSFGVGASDVWLIKTSSIGFEEWNQTYGGVDHDQGYSVQQTNDNGFIIAGYTVSYDQDNTGCDVLMIKTDFYGNKEWHQTYGGTGIPNKIDRGYSVQQTDDGGYIIIGDTEIYFETMSDVLMIKTDTDGNQQWCKLFGGSYTDRGRFVQQTGDNGFIICGWTYSFSISNPDIWLIKTDTAGDMNWDCVLGYGHESGDWGYSVQQTEDDGYIIIGSTMPEGWKNPEYQTSYDIEGTNAWLIKIGGENHPPFIPNNPFPEEGATDIAINVFLDWSGGDPDNDDVFYDLWFGPDNDLSLTAAQLTESEFNLPFILDYGSNYCWKIVAWDDHGASTEGPIWYFTTENLNNPPFTPSSPVPDNGAWDVPIDIILSWDGGDPDVDDVVSYDVYFGDEIPPPKISDKQSSTIYEPGSLKYYTSYFWRIVAWDNNGAKIDGPIWHFTTVEMVNNPPETPIITGETNGKAGIEYQYTFSTIDPDSDDVWYYIKWGDDTSIEWDGPYPSGEVITRNHTWEEQGTYAIKAKARDIFGEESDWGTLDVEMPKTKTYNNPLFQRFFESFPILEKLINTLIWLIQN